MKLANKTILAVLTGTALLAAHAGAGIIASDDFSAEGSGTGFAASTDWGTGNVSGGEYSTNTENYRNFATTTSSTDGTEIWVTFDVAQGEDTWGGLSFYNGTSEVLLLGRDTGHKFWGIDGVYVTDTYSTIPWVANQTVQLVGRLEFAPNLPSTTDHVSLWINPSDMSSLAALGTPDAETDDNNLGSYTRLRLGSGGTTGITVDNLIIGTSLADVAAIPEPSAILLIGLMVPVMFFMRRRRA